MATIDEILEELRPQWRSVPQLMGRRHGQQLPPLISTRYRLGASEIYLETALNSHTKGIFEHHSKHRILVEAGWKQIQDELQMLPPDDADELPARVG